VILLIVFFGSAAIVWARAKGLFGTDGWEPRLRASFCLLVLAVVSLWVVLGFEGRPTSDLGLRSLGMSAFKWGLLFGIAALMTFPIYLFVGKSTGQMERPSEALEVLTNMPLWGRTIFLLTAGFAEELLFRGIPIPRLLEIGNSETVAIGIPLIIFTLLHRTSWGVFHLLFVAVAGALMTAAFLIGGLWAAIIAHLVADAPMILAAPWMPRPPLDSKSKPAALEN